MSSDEQANSDPLPYTQVDRAVKPKATLLAALMGTTTQHALGSLVEFWDLNGDPRELEKLMADGKREVVLTPAAARLRFRLASAHDVEPESLEALGLLEKVEGGFRVRGMSRYFAPVDARTAKRKSAKAGGDASARARKEKYGTAQPRSGAGSESVREQFEHSPNTPRTLPELSPKHTPNSRRTKTEPQRSAVSGQRSAASELLEPARSRVLSDRLVASFLEKRRTPYKFASSVDGPALARLLKACPDNDEIDRRWRLGLDGTYQREVNTIAQLDAKWNALTKPDTKERPRDEETTYETQTWIGGVRQ